VYQSEERLGPDPRQARGQALVSGKADTWPPEGPLPFAVTPRKKLTVADVAAVLRDQAGRVPLFQKTTQEAAVFQLRAEMPRDLGCIYWRTSGRPDAAPLTPWYIGITETPESYRRAGDAGTRLSLEHHFHPPAGTSDRDLRLAWWKFKQLQELVDEDGKVRPQAVREAWSALESRLFARQRLVEEEARRRWQNSPDAARAYLTQHCAGVAEEAGREADRLCRVFRASQ
jgi:dipeptidase